MAYTSLLSRTAPDIEIALDDDNNENAQIRTITTFDSISGRVHITPPLTVRFDEIQIALLGYTRTYKIDSLTPAAAASRSQASHVFLRLTMPIFESDYPNPRVAEAGSTYGFPFHFVVPEKLLPTACRHETKGDHVNHSHLHLPPSMGEYILPLDDLAPEMSKICYAISVKLVRFEQHDNTPTVLAEAQRKLHLIPAIPESPPLHIDPGNREYVLSRSKTLKKGMFKGKLGEVTVSATQPRALILSPGSTCSPTAMANITVRFTPSSPDSPPPRLGTLTSKIRATTFHSIRAITDIPDHQTNSSPYEIHSGAYFTTIPLARRSVEAVPWTHITPSPNYMRRDSGYSSEDSESDCRTPTQNNGGQVSKSSAQPYYEASIVVPLSLPPNKTWLPTFHSCLISRFYALHLELAVHTPGTGVPATNLSLRLPIQIAAKPREQGRAEWESERARMEEVEREVNDQLPALFAGATINADEGLAAVVRRPSLPREEEEAPPGYVPVATRRARVVRS